MGSSATRAEAYTGGTITTASLQNSTQGFGVLAYYTGTADCYNTGSWVDKKPDFMFNQQVTYSTDHWTYTPVKFWPNEFNNRYADVDASQGAGEETDATNDAASQHGGKVSFFAYAPYSVVTDYTAVVTNLGKDKALAASGVPDINSKTKGVVAVTANTYEKQPEVKYVLGSNASSYVDATSPGAVDLLWGMRAKGSAYSLADGDYDTQANSNDIYNTDLTKQTVDETIDFYFKHALAKIAGHVAKDGSTPEQTGLRIVLDLDNGSKDGGVEPGTAIIGGAKEAVTLVTVNSITIQDLATYNTANPSNQRSGAGNLLNVGWFNIANGTWNSAEYLSTLETPKFTTTVDASTTNKTTTGTLNTNIAEQAITSESKLTYAASPGWKFGTADAITGVTATEQDVYTDDSNAPAILLIPSDEHDQTFVVTVTYTVRTFDTHLATVYENETTNTKVVQTITNQVTIPKGTLSANKYYKLLIHLGLTSVKFSAEVADWTDKDTNNNGVSDTGEESDSEQVIWLPSNTLVSTSTTVAAGSTSSVNVVAGTTSYTINLTGLTEGNTVVVSGKTEKAASATATITYTDAASAVKNDGKATVALTSIAANESTSESATSVITIQEKNGDDVISTTVVNITQGKKVN